MEIVPLIGSIILKRAKLRLDLPAPVRPTMPTWRNLPNLWASVFTFSLSKTSRLKFSRTQGNSGRYLVAYLTQVNLHKTEVGIITHPSNLISPVDGQFSVKGTSDSQSASWVRCFFVLNCSFSLLLRHLWQVFVFSNSLKSNAVGLKLASHPDDNFDDIDIFSVKY